jgi:hypothetical protein
MLLMEVISVYTENHTKPINTLCGQNAELLIIKVGGTLLLFKFWTFSIISLFLNHNVSREEPSLEMLWFKNKETMEKVQNLKSSNTAPSSKTFRDE